MSQTQLDDAGLRFIADAEGLRTQLYNDDWKPLATSQGNCTIGVGHLVHRGPCTYADPAELPFAKGITEDQALALFRADVQSRVDAVLALTPRLNANQLAAMVSFTFNCGIGAYQRSVAPVVNDAGDVCAAILPFTAPAWAHDALLKRRQAECALFHAPVNEEEDEMWSPINGFSVFFENRILLAGPEGTMQLQKDFPNTPPYTALDLDVYLAPDSVGSLILKHGSGLFAGKVMPRAPHQVIRIVPAGDGTAKFFVDGPSAHVERIGVVGYVHA